MYAEHGGGWVDAPLLVEALLAAATRRGASVAEQTPVAAVQHEHGHVTGVRTASGQTIPAEVVVNAAGSWAAHIGALAGCPVPLDLRPNSWSTPGRCPAARCATC